MRHRLACGFARFVVRLDSLTYVRRDNQIPFAHPQRQLDRFRQPRPHAAGRHQPIDDHFDMVPHLPVEPQIVGQLHDAAVDPCPAKSPA